MGHLLEIEKLPFASADALVEQLLEEKIITITHSDVYPCCILTQKGQEEFEQLLSELGTIDFTPSNQETELSPHETFQIIKQQELELENLKEQTQIEEISDAEIIQFLCFIEKILNGHNVFYVRPLVAESFLRENLGYSAIKASHFLNHLFEKKLIEDIEFQLNEGYVLTAHGRDFIATHNIKEN